MTIRWPIGRLTLKSPGDLVIYRSRLNAKINRNFEVSTATDFLAAITQHIPDKGAQMVRYYGWYSNKMRGVRHRGLSAELVPHRPGVSPPPPLELPSKRWRDLILRVWPAAPLRCPVCQNPIEPRCLLGRFEGGLVPGTGLFPPGLPRIALLLAPGLAARPLSPVHAVGDGAKPPETRQ